MEVLLHVLQSGQDDDTRPITLQHVTRPPDFTIEEFPAVSRLISLNVNEAF